MPAATLPLLLFVYIRRLVPLPLVYAPSALLTPLPQFPCPSSLVPPLPRFLYMPALPPSPPVCEPYWMPCPRPGWWCGGIGCRPPAGRWAVYDCPRCPRPSGFVYRLRLVTVSLLVWCGTTLPGSPRPSPQQAFPACLALTLLLLNALGLPVCVLRWTFWNLGPLAPLGRCSPCPLGMLLVILRCCWFLCWLI